MPSFRPATLAEADLLAELVNYAGEGLPLYLWGKLAKPGETALDVGRARARRDVGAFSWRNATIVEHASALGVEAAGALIGYPIAAAPEPIAADMPAMFRPLQELENAAPGTWYVNVLAVRPAFRGLGLGTALLQLADETGRGLGAAGMSVIVSDANTDARRLYERCGYAEAARRRMVKEGWANEGQDWVLLTKGL